MLVEDAMNIVYLIGLLIAVVMGLSWWFEVRNRRKFERTRQMCDSRSALMGIIQRTRVNRGVLDYYVNKAKLFEPDIKNILHAKGYVHYGGPMYWVKRDFNYRGIALVRETKSCENKERLG